jgi:hypothetical protein
LVTDARGRFTLRGIGRDCVVLLEVRDEPFGHQWLDVETDGRGPVKSVVRAVAPARVVEGVVVYEDTGKPAAGAQVILYQNMRRLLTTVRKYSWADARGRFRLNPCGPAFLEAKPSPDHPYQSQSAEVKWTSAAVLKQHLRLTLPRSVLVQGKVTDAGTGQPVAGARVMFWGEGEAYNLERAVTSGPDGTFRIGAPGRRGFLLVRAGPDYICQETYSGQLHRGRPGGRRLSPHSFIELNFKPGERVRTVAVGLHRGVTIRGRLIGPDGQTPARALLLSRLSVSPYHLGSGPPIEVIGGRFELHGCDPAQTYTVYFLDPKEAWGAAAEISAKRASGKRLTVRLAPCGSAEVRFVNAVGKPVAGYDAGVYLVVSPWAYPVDGNSLGALLTKPATLLEGVVEADIRQVYWDLRTDAKGRLTLGWLIPGVTYQLRWARALHQGYSMSRDIRARPGQRLRLADIVMSGVK